MFVLRATTWALILMLVIARAAHAEPCDLLDPPDPSADLPDDHYDDRNGDGIDGMRCGPIFVSPLGLDSNAGTIEAPMRSIGAAILAARSFAPPRDVYIAEGTYEGTVVLSGGVDLYGGYAAAGWLARSTDTRARIHLGPGSGDAALLGVGVAQPTVVDHLIIAADRDPDRAALGTTNVAALVLDGAGIVRFESCDLVAASGTDGASGPDGEPGASGGAGGNGGDAFSAGVFNGGSGGYPGAAGAGGDGAFNRGGEAGHGGPWCQGACACTSGPSNGTTGSGPAGGMGGTAAATGLPGAPGGNGASGTNGAPGIFASDGDDGSAGEIGSGGGGGGGAGTGGCSGPYVAGGGGGGGGGGGAGGHGGGGGIAGGSSYGVILRNAPASVAGRIVTGDGGVGGAGGAGGTGGVGGVGGLGGLGGVELGSIWIDGTGVGPETVGGAGGAGGAGGVGGHGGGGSGGNSIGILHLTGGSSSVDPSTTFTTGTAGAGGASLGNRGSEGIAAETYDSDLASVPIQPTCSPNCPPFDTHARVFTDGQSEGSAIAYIASENGFEPASAVSIVKPASHGAASASGSNVSYAPRTDFAGSDVFEYSACRATGGCRNGFAVVELPEPSLALALSSGLVLLAVLRARGQIVC